MLLSIYGRVRFDLSVNYSCIKTITVQIMTSDKMLIDHYSMLSNRDILLQDPFPNDKCGPGSQPYSRINVLFFL